MKMLPDGLGHFSDINSMGHKSSHPVENSMSAPGVSGAPIKAEPCAQDSIGQIHASKPHPGARLCPLGVPPHCLTWSPEPCFSSPPAPPPHVHPWTALIPTLSRVSLRLSRRTTYFCTCWVSGWLRAWHSMGPTEPSELTQDSSCRSFFLWLLQYSLHLGRATYYLPRFQAHTHLDHPILTAPPSSQARDPSPVPQ